MPEGNSSPETSPSAGGPNLHEAPAIPGQSGIEDPQSLPHQTLPHVGDRPLHPGGLEAALRPPIIGERASGEPIYKVAGGADNKPPEDNNTNDPYMDWKKDWEGDPEEVTEVMKLDPDNLPSDYSPEESVYVRRFQGEERAHREATRAAAAAEAQRLADVERQAAEQRAPAEIERLERLPPIEALPSIETIERMESLEEVVDVLWKWHALADREPSLMWTEENEKIMDAAFAKYSEMFDVSEKDITDGQLGGLIKNIKDLKASLEPTDLVNKDNPDDPANKKTWEYEKKKVELEDIEREIKIREAAEVMLGLDSELQQVEIDLRAADGIANNEALSEDERKRAREDVTGLGNKRTILQRKEQRDPVKRQIKDLTEQTEKLESEIKGLEKQIQRVAGDSGMDDEQKIKIINELQKKIELYAGARDRKTSERGFIEGTLKPSTATELQELEKEKVRLERELGGGEFKIHRQLDEKLEAYAEVLANFTGEFARKYGADISKDIGPEKDMGREVYEQAPDFNVVLDKYFTAQALLETRGLTADQRETALEALDVAEEVISTYIAEAERIGIITEKETEKFDHMLEQVKEQLAPHGQGGYGRGRSLPADPEALAQAYKNEAYRYLEDPGALDSQGQPIYARDFRGRVIEQEVDYDDNGIVKKRKVPIQLRMQDAKWQLQADAGNKAFTDETRTRFDGLLPFLYYRAHIQAADVAMGFKHESGFPDRLPNRRLLEGEWDISEAEKRVRVKGGGEFYEDSGAGYYYITATNLDEFRMAAEHFARVKIKSGVIKREPNTIFQEREKFVLAMSSQAAKANLDLGAVRRVMLGFEMEVAGYAARVSNRNNKPELVAQILQVVGEYEDGLERYRLMTQLLGGDLAAAMYVLDRQGGSEILFRPWGAKNQLGNETHKYLMLHKVATGLLSKKLLGVDLNTESLDEDALGKGVVYPEGYDAVKLRQALPELEAKSQVDLSPDERKILRMARAQKDLDESPLSNPELVKKFTLASGQIRLQGDAARKRNLEKVGRYQSKEDFEALYDWDAHRTRLVELEVMDRQGLPMTTKEIELLNLGRIQRKLDSKDPSQRKLTKREKAYYEERLADKRNAVEMALQFYSLTQQIAVRGDPSYICGNGLDVQGRGKRALARLAKIQAKQAAGNSLSSREQDILKLAEIQQQIDTNLELNPEQKAFYESNVDISHRKREGKDVAVERREAHFVSKRLAKKFVTAGDNWAKRKYDRLIRIRSIPADEDGSGVKGWEEMDKAEREELFKNVKVFYDPFYGTDLNPDNPYEDSEIMAGKRKLVQQNWARLTPRERLSSLLEAKGNPSKNGRGLINVIPTPTSKRLWDDYDDSKRQTAAAKVWRSSQAENWILLTRGERINQEWRKKLSPQDQQKLSEEIVKYAFDNGKQTLSINHWDKVDTSQESGRDALEDLMQDVRFRMRKLVREKNIDELQKNGFNARLKNLKDEKIKFKIGERRPKAEIQPDGSVKIVGYVTVPVEKEVDVMTASTHPFGQFLGITYIAQQNEIRNQILSKKITDQCKQILAGTLRWEDADPLALLRLVVDPTLRRMQALGGEISDPDSSKNLESKMRTMVFAQVHESFFGSDRIEKELRGVFVDPNNADNRVSWHWTNEDIGSKRVVNLAEYIATYMNSLSRRMRSGIADVSQPITSEPEMFAVGPMGVLGIPMLINRRGEQEEKFLQEILDPPELNAYGHMVASAVKVRDAEITHLDEQGKPIEGSREKPTNNVDDWRSIADKVVQLFTDKSAWEMHSNMNTTEKILRETLGRNEAESRVKVAMLRFFRTAGEEMLVERNAMFSEDNRYMLDRDTDRLSPPPVSGSRAFVNDGIYEQFLWMLSEEGRRAYPDAEDFYKNFNMEIVDWYIGKVTL